MAKAGAGGKSDSTPMMKQYRSVKAEHPDKMVLFHLGDFYEMFGDDAHKAADLLGLTLTSRQGIPMAGMPVHAAANYIRRLLEAGEKAVVCDQVEDPKQAKGLVRREVTRIVTPGTVIEEELLDAAANNFMLAVKPSGEECHLAWADLSTGELYIAAVREATLEDEISRILPREILVSENSDGNLPAGAEPITTTLPAYLFEETAARVRLMDYYGVQTLEGMGLDDESVVGHIGALVAYVAETQKASAPVLGRPQDITYRNLMVLDANALRNLEIVDEAGERGKPGGLLAVLDNAVTAMGKRMLRSWLIRPSADRDLITRRHEVVSFMVERPELADALRAELRKIQDLERLTAKLDAGRATPREVGAVGLSLGVIPRLLRLVEAAGPPPAVAEIVSAIDELPELRGRISGALVDEPPTKDREGGIFREGCSADIDRLRALHDNARQWLIDYREAESSRTGIKNLKIAYNRVFGYYIEVSKSNLYRVPDDYERRQTLANSERFITPVLRKHEEEVLTAEERLRELEYSLFVELRDYCRTFVPALRLDAGALGALDVLMGFSEIARKRRYVRPRLAVEALIEVKNGRHPVVEARLPTGSFIPNDISMSGDREQIMVLTGPNMAGKSTYIRQAAIMAVMCQAGSFVPAEEAEMGIFDRVFARIGASDDIAGGRSTFMVEMVETATILNNATSHSLVVLDEVGRGTSTFDGLSLAWAIVEYLHENERARPVTLFATHYHELTAMAQEFKRIRNHNVAVREWEGEVVFLHRIVPGGMDKSYGIHVARIAGVPDTVVSRATGLLERLEEHAQKLKDEALGGGRMGSRQLSLFVPVASEVEKELAAMVLDHMAPVDALQALQLLRERALKNLAPG
ncbi:MAG: DNA mismatch repair protein MutS [Planctomycetes bacterium]|nr:DNA mismatch repair protein MutS [Planctomycetota bacterium]